MAEKEPSELRLLAQDADDLEVVSAHMQDAVVRVGDMTYLPKERRFALVASRFDWLAAEGARLERRHAGLHFDHVLRVSRLGVDQGQPNAMLNLLSVAFEAGEAPAGAVTLTFSGGGAIRLEVECVEAQLRDLGSRWKTRRRPGHQED
jgi:hypothetical protein